MTDSQKLINVPAIAGMTLTFVALIVGLAIWMVQPSDDKKVDGPTKEVHWTDLRQYDFKAHTGPAWLLALNGTPIKIAGYVVPMESRPVTKEFVFVPDQLACVHVPPPPPNLMIYVHSDKEIKIDDLAGPQWLFGTLEITDSTSPFGQISYVVKSNKLEIYRL